MADTVETERVAPFESASELRGAHSRLLEALDSQLGPDASAGSETAALVRIATEIRQFLDRGAATGVYLEEIRERTACQVLLDYWVSSLSRAGVQVSGVRLARFDSQQLPDLKDKPCPYVGLEAFRDQTFFFGREADTQALLAQIRGAPLLVVLGASGSGKSSLVMGGVLRALAAKDAAPELLVVRPFVPGNAVLDNLADAVLRIRAGGGGDVDAEVSALRRDSGHLSAMVGGVDAPPTLITIDQFEEVFTLSTPEDREVLVASLARLLEAGRGHRVILTMREEFKARMVALGALSTYLDKAWYSMRPMGYEDLKAAVESPAALVNLQFQSGIVDDLVRKVLGQPAALPLLQFTLRSLWEKRDRNRITREVYHRVGDPLKALETSADQFYDGLATQTRDEVRRILLELVRVDELLEAYRQPVPRSHLLLAGKADTEQVLELLERKDYVRVTLGPKGADAVVEVKHEALLRNWPRFVEWIDDKRLQRRQRLALSEAARRWEESGKPQEGLLTGWQLQAAEGQADLSELEREFVQTSREAIDRTQREKEAALRQEADQARALAAAEAKSVRRLRYLVGMIVVIAVIVVGGILYTIKVTSDRDTFLQQLAIYSTVDEHLDDALLLAIEANRMAPGQESERRLLSALATHPEFQSLLPGHKGAVRAVAFSPKTGNILASASDDGTIILRDAGSGLMLHPPLLHPRDPALKEAGVYRLAFSTDEKTLASAGAKAVALWNVESGRLIDTLRHDDTVYSVAIEKGGKTLASSGKDGIVRLWNIERRQVEASFRHSQPRAEGGSEAVYNVAFSPDGTLLASGGEDKRIVLWDVNGRRRAGEPLMVHREVFSMAFSHDGKTIASGNEEGRVDLWDVPRRKWAGSPNLARLRAVFGVAFSPDDTQIATASKDRAVYVSNVGDHKAAGRHLKGYAEPFYSVDFAADGKVATGAGNGTVVLWNLNATSRLSQVLQAPTKNSTAAIFSRGGKTLVSFSEDELLFWDRGKGDLWTITSREAAAQAGIHRMVSTPDGKALVTVGSDRSVKLWDVAQRRPIKTLVPPTGEEILVTAIAADSRTLAIGVRISSKQKEIRLLNLPDGKIRKTLAPSDRDVVWALAFSPTENLLASAGWNTGITIWDLETSQPRQFEEQRQLLEHVNVASLAFSPSGRILASGGGTVAAGGGKDRQILLWDVKTGSRKGIPLALHRDTVQSLKFSPSGKLLASASKDHTVLLWDVETQQKVIQPLQGHGAAVLSVAFSPDGQQVVSSDEEGSIIAWRSGVASWSSLACAVAGRNFTENEWKEWDRTIGLRSRRWRLFDNGQPRITCPQATVREADERALAGDRAGAEQLFAQALRLALARREWQLSNEVCWLGSVHGFAKMVLPACEQMVALAPEASKDYYKDSRGLARALTGDTAGAIEDFTAAVESLKALKDMSAYEGAFLQRRRAWIVALKDGRNPFQGNETLLNSLRTE